MELTGEEMIPQPIQRVWDGLNDPDVLKACISGCEEIVKAADNEYKVVLMAAVGPVKARFNGKLLLSDINPPISYSLIFEGTGGAAGFAKGGAQVTLSRDGPATKLAYNANAKIGGKIAQVGSRLIEGVARKIAAEFFARFNEIVAQQAPAEAAAQSAVEPRAEPIRAVPPSMPAAEQAAVVQKKEGKAPAALWIVLAVVAASLITYFWH
jgi:carbon monoxide dehydrogenase subunit G